MEQLKSQKTDTFQKYDRKLPVFPIAHILYALK